MNGYLKKKKKAMLYRGSKIGIICLLLIFCACKKELTKEEIQKQIQKEEKVRIKQRKLYYTFSRGMIGDKEYDNVLKNANDSLKNWINHKLPSYISIAQDPYEMDSLICFNREKNKFVSAILSKCQLKKCVQDDIYFFYGIKIKGAWYFFRGASITLPREYYQENIHKPLSYKKMKDIAIKEVFSGYLKQERDSNKYVIDENFFNDITDTNYRGFEKCVTTEDFDNAYLNEIKVNWLITYKPLKEEEIHYNYDRSNKKLRIGFPIHLPNLRDSPLRGIAIRYWEKLPPKEEEKQINRLTLMEEFDSRESKEKGLCEEGEYKNDYVMVDAKGMPIKMYSKLITGIEPNKQYTMKITFDYPDGWAFFVTDFSTSNERGEK